MIRVPFLDVKASYMALKSELDSAFRRCMESGTYILGDEVEFFEKEFASFHEVQHCVGVANGLEALQLILMALGIGPDDEVIVPAHTFVATWLAVSFTGARPVAVDVRRDTYNIDAALIQNAITKRTRAILPVHLYGQPADMDAILRAIDPKQIAIVEDAAQAQGAMYRGKFVGGFGAAAGVSFYPGKNLGAYGDAGAVLTDRDDLDERIRQLRNYGSRKKYYHEQLGLNSRLDPLQAAFLRVKLQKLSEWNARRREFADYYLRALSNVPGISLPIKAEGCEPVWHLFVICCSKRDALQAFLAEYGIETLIHYPVPPYLSGAYAAAYEGQHFPVAEEIANTALSLPIGPHMTMEQAEWVVEIIKRFAA